MGVGIDGRGYLGQMRVHGLAIAVGHDQARRFAFGRADGAEDIDPFGALVVRRPGPGAPARPTPCDLVFLTDARFVLPPKLYLDTIRETLAELRQLGREVFLKSSNANSFWAWRRGRAVILVNPIAFNSLLTVGSVSEMRNLSQIHCARSLSRQRTTPWIAGIGPSSTISTSARLNCPGFAGGCLV